MAVVAFLAQDLSASLCPCSRVTKRMMQVLQGRNPLCDVYRHTILEVACALLG